jgi:arylsulfatase A-like enzyme
MAAAAVAAVLVAAGLVVVYLGSPPASTAAQKPLRVEKSPSLHHLLQRTAPAQGASALSRLTPVSDGELEDARRRARSGAPWNIVIIDTDDQPKGTEFGMPTVRRELIGKGITFSGGLIPTPVCCPSRASLLTGLFAQGTGVYDNTQGGVPGGNRAFVENGNESKTFAVALKKIGYRTGLFGKYLNQYGKSYEGFAPQGWDDFVSFTSKSRYFGFSVTRPYKTRDAKRVRAGKQPFRVPYRKVSGYSTSFFGKQVADFIRTTPQQQPLLAVYTPYAPHTPSIPEKRYRHSLTDTGWWLTDPSVMEADVWDKPYWVGQTPVSPNVDKRPLGLRLVKQRETLLTVDDEVSRILRALKETKRLNRTIVVFTSDNGYMHGQHRLSRKGVPYRGATEVPLVMRIGGGQGRGTVDARVAAANIDVAATILDVAGLPNTTQGYSLLGPAQRSGVPLLGVAAEFEGVARPPYCGWRTSSEMFVRYGSGEEEYYDYSVDPYELENAVADPAFAARVEQLRESARTACDPTPPRFGPTFDEPTWAYDDVVPRQDRDAEE